MSLVALPLLFPVLFGSDSAGIAFSLIPIFLYLTFTHSFSLYAQRALASTAYELIVKYDLWYYLLHEDEGWNVPIIFGMPLYRSVSHIPPFKSFDSKIWWFAGCLKSSYIMGETEKSYKLLLNRNALDWPTQLPYVIKQLFGVQMGYPAFYIPVIVLALGILALSFLYPQHSVIYGYTAGFMFGSIAAVERRISRVAFAAAYYKLFTDKWPWED